MEELIQYDGLIYSIISKYPKRFDRDDLYQVGMLGLVNAYRHYKKEFNTKFSTFAYYYIVGEVNKFVRENSTLKVSKDLIELNKRIIKTKELLQQRLGREATGLELSLFLEVDESVISNAISSCEEVLPIDSIYESSGYTDKKVEFLDLKNEIELLPEDEKKLILARYYNDLTQSETSKILGISQVQVSRKESKILEKLKARL